MATKLYLPNLLEFIYHSITEKGFPYLFDRLDREDWVKVKNESRARTFAEFANIEDKMLLMSKLGKGCALVFWDKEKVKTKKVEDVVIAYIDTPDENNLTKQIVKDKVFACRDIHFIQSIFTMAKSSMSKVYSISRRFLHIKEGSFKTRTLVNKFEAERNLDWYCRTIQAGLDLPDTLELFKLNIVQFRILLALQTAPNGVTREFLIKKLGRQNLTGILTEMYNMNMIDYSMTNKSVITIDVYGVMILEKIIAKFP